MTARYATAEVTDRGHRAVVVAGLFAMAEAALTTVSPAARRSLAGPAARRDGSTATASDKPRHVNLLLLLRLLCEMVATTLVAMVAFAAYRVGWRAGLTAGTMTLVSYIVVGVAPRLLGGKHAYLVGRMSAPLVRWLGRALGPLASLLILVETP